MAMDVTKRSRTNEKWGLGGHNGTRMDPWARCIWATIIH